MLQRIAVATVVGLSASVIGGLIEKAAITVIRKRAKDKMAKEEERNYILSQRNLILTEFVD